MSITGGHKQVETALGSLDVKVRARGERVARAMNSGDGVESCVYLKGMACKIQCGQTTPVDVKTHSQPPYVQLPALRASMQGPTNGWHAPTFG